MSDVPEILRRVCTRCPSAAEEPLVQQILSSQVVVSPANFLQALKALMLRPHYAIPTATICRPAVLAAVAGLVDDELSATKETERAVLLAATLPRLLLVAPHVELEVLRYFHQRPGPFHYLEPPCDGGVTAIDLARATLWGLQSSQELVSLWKWPMLVPMLSHVSTDVRWCGARCLGLTLGGGDTLSHAAMKRALPDEDEATQAAIRWHSTCVAIAAERATMFCDSVTMTKDNWAMILPTPTGYVDVFGLALPRRSTAVSHPNLVMMPSIELNLRAIALGLCLSSPILLEGPPACGKSKLISHLAAMTGNAREAVYIHLDDQTDSKSLLGAYVCTSKPGEFVWQPGPLAQAVSQGCWAVIEHIDLAPAEVLATLLPLIERRVLHIPSRGEEIQASPGFQLLATITTHPGGLGAGAYGSSQTVRDVLGGHFHVVKMQGFSLAEQESIVAHRFPSLAPLLPYALASVAATQLAMKQCSPADLNAYVGTLAGSALAEADVRPGECTLGRMFGFRDVLKWALRMHGLHAPLLARSLRGPAEEYRSSAASIPIAVREAAFIETADCLCGGVSHQEVADKLLLALASAWAVPRAVAEQYSQLGKPAVNVSGGEFVVGRASLVLQQHQQPRVGSQRGRGGQRRFAETAHAMRLMERVAVAVSTGESLLLVGETGTGKTTLVQELANQVDARLVVINVSQQTDSSDLIGGYRPLQPADGLVGLLSQFSDLVRRTWQRGNNEEFLGRITKMAAKRRWEQLARAYRTAVAKVGSSSFAAESQTDKYQAPIDTVGESDTSLHYPRPSKKQRRNTSASIASPQLHAEWSEFGEKLDAAEATARAAEGGFAFGFVEGVLVQAVREGWWLLLDEINLAPAEALERIAGLLEDDGGSITVAERGDVKAVERHPNFRLLAAMNPATDAGKRDLPAPLRNRFTELWVGEPGQREDLAAIVARYLLPVSTTAPVDAVVNFYIEAKRLAETVLQDGAGHKPAYNLRTLSRALEYAAQTATTYGLQRALYDGFAMSFLTQLQVESASHMERLLHQHLLGKGVALKTLMQAPAAPSEANCVLFDHYWVQVGDAPVAESRDSDGKGGVFVDTPTVTQHLRNLARAVLLRKYPILLQGPTSSGKTSLVAFLAAQTGHHFVRINNHEQTDLQEYLGTYVSDDRGRLVFQEGPLVQAIRRGHWIVLDELNLAPTEVLEALNRLLDDNRELFIPELQEVIKPHPNFMLFATQNPPGLYAGRKTLSKAFRSRFLELHIEEIPDDELHIILEKRCAIAPSYATKLVAVMRELQRRRALSNVFAGRHGFITPRDLFRWAGRGAVGYDQLAVDGFAVLGERLRSAEERSVVQEVLEKFLKVKMDMEGLYNAFDTAISDTADVEPSVGRLVWTKGFRRMYWLLSRCLTHAEPALLVGETGLGKTSVCQMAALMRKQMLRIINCNQHTETSDFLGGYRPNRGRERAMKMLRKSVGTFNNYARSADVPELQWPVVVTIENLTHLLAEAQAKASNLQGTAELETLIRVMEDSLAKYRAPFEWVDGPLVLAMRHGDILLIDELNLAEDAVLERLNSVLEPSRSLTLAEKGGKTAEVIIAHPNFRLVATMNPGGDFGKKELSPALSNRFTTIWVPVVESESEVQAILESRLNRMDLVGAIPPRMLTFLAFFRKEVAGLARQALSIRDLLTWIAFVNATTPSLGPLLSYAHGAHVAFIDGVGLGVGLPEQLALRLRAQCRAFLETQIPSHVADSLKRMESHSRAHLVEKEFSWGFDPFFLAVSQDAGDTRTSFAFDAPTTARNTFRILRALQLSKPLLLEGSPGVGKTSLIAAIAKRAGQRFVRVNLSDQTDMMDLLGADLPVDGGDVGEFLWSDGPLLEAIKSGAWVLLDELNLANQTILEGLNALLDHRAEVYIPELGRTFQCAPGFRIFGAQNPLHEGGGRKGLPKSFLNRFTRVQVDLLQPEDLLFIAQTLYPSMCLDILQRMVKFLGILHCDANERRVLGNQGGPWEFNLRDLLRWSELLNSGAEQSIEMAKYYAGILYTARMRTAEDRGHIADVLASCFGHGKLPNDTIQFKLIPDSVRIGMANLERARTTCFAGSHDRILLGSSLLHTLEHIIVCVARNWMCLLVGPSGTGKTTAVRTLAQLCGRRLIELPLNPGTDTSDLLGGFEQIDVARKRSLLSKRTIGLLSKLVALGIDKCLPKAIVDEATYLACRWDSQADSEQSVASVALCAIETVSRVKAILNGVLSTADVQQLLELMEVVERDARSLTNAERMAGTFEWVDGSLTRAILEGYWVVMDNANLCNPSVLDRLNPLLEPHGVLYLNECGSGSKGPRILKPHPNFRLFLSMDPKNGEVSRAMRNRGIEVFFLHSENGLGNIGVGQRHQPASEELAKLVGGEQVPGLQLPTAMVTTHAQLRYSALVHHNRPPSTRELKRWADLFQALASRGINASEAHLAAYEHVYHAYHSSFDGEHATTPKYPDPGRADTPWLTPGGWPVPMTAQAAVMDSRTAVALRDIGPVLWWAGNIACSGNTQERLARFNTSVLASAIGAGGFGMVAVLPGQWLAAVLTSNEDAPVTSQPVNTDQIAILESMASLEHAAVVFMERSQRHHQTWAAALLRQCIAVCDIAGSTSTAKLVDVNSALHAYFAHPLCSTSSHVPPPLEALEQTSAKLPFLRVAVIHAVVLQRIAAVVDIAQADNDGLTLLQLSHWRFAHPKARSRFPIMHPAVDWLWPVLTALQALEEALLEAPEDSFWTDELATSLHDVQNDRWAVLFATHVSSAAIAAKLDMHIETVVYSWTRLRTSIQTALALLPSQISQANMLKEVMSQLDTMLGLRAGPSPAPLLWQRGGKPMLPTTFEHLQVHGQLCMLSEIGSLTASGDYAAVHPLILSAATAALQNLPASDGAQVADRIEQACMSICMALSSNIDLRRQLVEGACLFEAMIHMKHSTAKLRSAQNVVLTLEGVVGRHAVFQASLAVSDNVPVLQSVESRLKIDAMILPPSLMHLPEAREMQLQLAAWVDLDISKRLLGTFAGRNNVAPLLSYLCYGQTSGCHLDASLTDAAFDTIIASGCRELGEAKPYMLLSWLHDASRTTGLDAEWLHELQQSATHDAWFWWHRGLWGHSASMLPQNYYASSDDVVQSWNRFDGPMRMHTCTLSSHAAGVLCSPGVSIQLRSLKTLQLQLAGRHLRSLCGACALRHRGVAFAEWRASIVLLAVTLTAYLPVLVEFDDADTEHIPAVIQLFLESPSPDVLGTHLDKIMAVLSPILRNCSHVGLQEVGSSLLLRAVELLCSGAAVSSDANGLTVRGRAWVLLGLARLHLSVPPAGADPAAEQNLHRQYVVQSVQLQLRPALIVRQQYAALPGGGPSEEGDITELRKRIEQSERLAAELDGRSPARPSPSQYLALREDVGRVLSSLASIARVSDMLDALNGNSERAADEARIWQESIASASARFSTQYGAYKDILQPLQLAVQEMRYGFSLVLGAYDMQRSTAKSVQQLSEVITCLISFPAKFQQGNASQGMQSVSLDLLAGQESVASLVMQTAKSRLAVKTNADVEVVGHAAALQAKLELLRVVMHESRMAWRRAATPTAVAAATFTVESVFDSFVGVWEEVKQEEARRAAEEAELFKTKLHSSTILNEDQEAEEDFREQFPDQNDAFAGLEDMDEGNRPMEAGDYDTNIPHEKAISSRSNAAAYFSRDVLLGTVLPEVVRAHSEIFHDCAKDEPAEPSTLRSEFLQAYSLGMQLMQHARGQLLASVDDSALTGHLYATALRFGELQAPLTGSALENDDGQADIYAAHPAEAVLVEPLLKAVQVRLSALLTEWPDHPVLCQLETIVSRVMSLSVMSPLKTLLTGLELLLARAQLWEETAAKHVTMESELKAVAALATRWRRLELARWRSLLKKTVLKVADNANIGWFHLYRILLQGNSPVTEVAAAVGDFVQTAPMGEYATRLNLLAAFEGQLTANSRIGGAQAERRHVLGAILHNVRRYYSQFLPTVESVIATGLAPHERDLRDFVKLAKWEDRGYYAMKAATEKAQRHLHKLCRRATEVLKEPVTAALANAAKTMGINDLESPETVSLLPHKAPASVAAMIAALTSDDLARDALAKSRLVFGHLAASEVERLPPCAGKYTQQLPDLVQRFPKVLARGFAYNAAAGALAADGLAAEAASRAVQLRADVSKGAKARKKKALVDFFHALADFGVSKLRSAVPAEKRGVQAWFEERPPNISPLLGANEVALGDQTHLAEAAWHKADAYLYASMARLQRLQEAARHPHNDLMPAEVEAASRNVEHLLYLTQCGRTALGELAEAFDRLRCLSKAMSHAKVSELRHQSTTSAACRRQQDDVSALLALAAQTHELLTASTHLEPANEVKRDLEIAAASLQTVRTRLELCDAKLKAATASTLVLPNGKFFVTGAVRLATSETAIVLATITEELADSPHAHQPGWAELVAAFAATTAEIPVVDSIPASGTPLKTVGIHLEACVKAALLWAQGVQTEDSELQHMQKVADRDDAPLMEKDDDARHASLPAAVADARRRMDARRLLRVALEYSAALAAVAALADDGDISDAETGLQMLVSAMPLVNDMCTAAWQLGARCLALHRSLAKLTYVSAALFAGVAEEGFCMPEGEENGEPEEGEGAMTQGTGLGEADTRGAKDISNELEDQDQLLGAQQKGQEREEDVEEPPLDGEVAQGVEMDDDFQGALEDVVPQDGEDQQDEDDEDGEEDRLQQQMGDLGDAGEDVDEKLWNGEDENDMDGSNKEEAGHDKDHALKVDDASKLDYAQGQEDEQEPQDVDPEKQQKSVEAPQHRESQEEPDTGGNEGVNEDEDEDEAEPGDYQDRPEDRGFVQPEAPDAEMQLPDDMNLDGGDDEPQQDEEAEEEATQHQDRATAIEEQAGAFPEQNMDDGMGEEEEEEEKEGQGDDDLPTEMDHDEGMNAADAAGMLEGAQEDEGNEERGQEQENEDARIVDAEEQPQPETAPEAPEVDGEHGKSVAQTMAGIDSGGAGAQDVDQAEIEGPKDDNIAMPEPAAEPQEAAGGSAAGAAGGLQHDARASRVTQRESDRNQAPELQNRPNLAETNPFRSLGSALERWRSKLQMASEALPQQPEEGEAAAVHEDENGQAPEAEGDNVDGEFRFVGEDEARHAGDMQTMAAATQDQVWDQITPNQPEEGANKEGIDEPNEETLKEDDMVVDDVEGEVGPVEAAETIAGQAGWGAGEKTGLEQQNKRKESGNDNVSEKIEDDMVGGDAPMNGEQGNDPAQDEAVTDGVVSSRLQATHLGNEPEYLLEMGERLSEDRAEELRVELDRRLRAASEGALVDEGDMAHGQAVWGHCEALTSGLVGELTEQLRLILEPTLASKLGGEYRTGKRINMKRVIGYIASHYRKDKIWMRKTQPDKRRYQVLVAVDDSRSMAETGCGTFALEALTLICRAMARLEVGELGVVSFGGSGGAEPLHSLEKPFTDADGVRVMSRLRFDADNTIGDQPMVDVITSIDHLLDGASARAAASASGPATLHQLVLIIADGRFHEKEALRRAARDAASRPGVLYAFIVLDNPSNSILDMQSVSFTNGKPVFTRYIDTFPFPYYIVLRDIAALPRTLADLMRQWFELQQH